MVKLYAGLERRFTNPSRAAEMLKYPSNAFHAIEDRFRQRDRHACKAPASTATKSMDIFKPGHATQHLAGLSASGLRLRRLVPAEGRRALPIGRGSWIWPCRCSKPSCRSNDAHIERRGHDPATRRARSGFSD